MQDLRERFLSKIVHVESHWIWIGATTPRSRNGLMYGGLSLGKGIVPAHRASHTLFIGDIPEGYLVLHKRTCEKELGCWHGLCVCPDHVYAGRAQNNSDDMYENLRYSKHATKILYHRKKLQEQVEILVRKAHQATNPNWMRQTSSIK
jgi:hypothetical protein